MTPAWRGRACGRVIDGGQAQQHLGPDSLILLRGAANVHDVTAVNGELREVTEGSRLRAVRLKDF